MRVARRSDGFLASALALPRPSPRFLLTRSASRWRTHCTSSLSITSEQMASGKAIVINKCGGTDVLELVNDFAVPAPKAGEVLVKLVSASINPVDTYVRAGAYAPKEFPKVIGGDLAGHVHLAGEGSKFKTGDAVYGLSDAYLPFSQFEGTYAQYALIKDEWLAAAPSPDKMTLVDSSAVPLVALTALQALEKAEPKKGQTILIFGASGGVGHVAVQLAKTQYGLNVTAVSSKKYADWVKSLGADSVWEYDTQGGVDGIKSSFADKKFDIVLDVVGGDYIKAAYEHALKKEGVLSHVLNRGGVDAAFEAEVQKASDAGTGPKFFKTLVQPSGQSMALFASLINEGKLKVKVAKTMPLKEAGKGHDLVIDGHAGGKVVLTL